MQRIVLLLFICCALSSFGNADSSHAELTTVKHRDRHHHEQHHAHRAAKHHTQHHRHASV